MPEDLHVVFLQLFLHLSSSCILELNMHLHILVTIITNIVSLPHLIYQMSFLLSGVHGHPFHGEQHVLPLQIQQGHPLQVQQSYPLLSRVIYKHPVIYQQRCTFFGCIGQLLGDVNQGLDGVTDALVDAAGNVIDGTAHGIGAVANGTGSGIGDVVGGAGDLLGGAAGGTGHIIGGLETGVGAAIGGGGAAIGDAEEDIGQAIGGGHVRQQALCFSTSGYYYYFCG